MTARLSAIEKQLIDCPLASALSLTQEKNLNVDLLSAALHIKNVAGRINDIVHAIGILVSLPKTMSADEKIISMSLGAGNTGRSWDLETTHQIAEFKFIRWQGEPETVRQNGLFKDFFFLSEADTFKRRNLYLLGCERPEAFLKGRRKIDAILNTNAKLATAFKEKHSDQFVYVRDYFEFRSGIVELVDLIPLVPEFQMAEVA